MTKRKPPETHEKTGRPRKFPTLDSLKKGVESYFYSVENEKGSRYGDVPDIEGLCMHLDTCRDTLCEYEKEPIFSDTIKKAKDKIFYFKKQGAYKGKYNPAVFIFDAKNNHGYRDKIETENKTELSGGITLTVSDEAKKTVEEILQ